MSTDQSTKIKFKKKKKKKTLQIKMMLAAEGGFVKLRDGVEGGNVGGGVKGGLSSSRTKWRVEMLVA